MINSNYNIDYNNLDKYFLKDFKLKITEKIIIQLGELADKFGFQVYIIGGYVRDYILNRSRNDFDFTVVGDCFSFAKIVAEHFHSTPIFYTQFRTALVPIGEYKLEFVGTRNEVYKNNSRNPKVSEGTLFDDIKRRDFTINTLAASINKNSFGSILDVFNGIDDIKNKKIITPLDPELTFSEDPLRIMRAARFASQLNFDISDELIQAAKIISDRINIISKERISEEFLKIIASPKPSIGIELLDKMEILDKIFPEFTKLKGSEIVEDNGIIYNHKDVYIHTLKVLDKVAEKSDNLWLRIAALLHDIAKPKTKSFQKGTGWTFHGHEELGARWVKRIFKNLKFPFQHIPYVENLIRLHLRPMALVNNEVNDSAYRRLAFNAGDALNDLFTLCLADITTNNPTLNEKYFNNYEKVRAKVIEVQEKDKLREFQSPVRGEEIMEICSIPPSRTVGHIKLLIEEAILDNIIPNEYEAAKNYFLANKEQWIADFKNSNYKKSPEN